MRYAQGAQFLQPVIFRLFLLRELRPVEGQIDEAREQCDICRGHLLAGKDDTCIHRRRLLLLVQVHIHAGTSRAVPQALQELPLVEVDVILELIDMHQGVCHCRHRVIQGRQRGILNIRRHISGNEEAHQRMSQFRLARAFRAEEIQDWEAACLSRHDVAEQGGQQEAESDAPVVAENAEYL